MVVCLLFGGQSSEYEVSLASACSVLGAIDRKKYIIYKIGITKDGGWLLFDGADEEIFEDKWHKNKKNKPICVDISGKCFKTPTEKIIPDVIFPIMHGEYGEDGRVQALCELMGVRCVGIPSDSAVICMDKEISKTIAMRELVPVVPYVSVRAGYDIDKICAEIGESVQDVFVKPSKGGSSVGISRTHTKNELAAAIERALKYSDTVLIEEAIHGIECEVAVLEHGTRRVVSEVGSLSYKSDFYDYDTKYHSGDVKYKIPAKIPQNSADLCRKYAKILFSALKCRGMSRVDFFVTDAGEVYFNEINAIPGFTAGSMYPMLMAHMGYEMRTLIDILIDSAK